jgi:hypothetical protein
MGVLFFRISVICVICGFFDFQWLFRTQNPLLTPITRIQAAAGLEMVMAQASGRLDLTTAESGW